ncbi:MAG: type II toxin-antitoxin system RelE/ParE family toxin [Chitinophagaceae bacterium]
MVKFTLTNKAVEDFSNIWNYTFDTWSESQADKYYRMLLESCQDIAGDTVTGKHYPEIDEDIFGFKCGQHIIFYTSLPKEKILIARILHSKWT